MSTIQNTTNNTDRQPQTPFFDSAFEVTQPIQEVSSEEDDILFVHCEICPEKLVATRRKIRNSRWGVYENCAFCPICEEKI